MTIRKTATMAALAALGTAGAAIAAVDPELICESSRLALSGKYGACRLSTEARALKAGISPDFAKCSETLSTKWIATDTRAFNAGGYCIDSGDVADITEIVDVLTGAVGKILAGDRFDASGATIIDHQTGLEWEKKTSVVGSGANFSDPHDVDNTYGWCAGTSPNCTNPNNPFDGTAATDFLAKLNGSNTGVCYAGHCDWRLPTVEEYEVLLTSNTNGAFLPSAASFYWTARTSALNPALAWYLDTAFGYVGYVYGDKTAATQVRAVRSGS